MPKVSDSNGAEWGKSDLNVFGLGFTQIAGGTINALTGANNRERTEASFTSADELQQNLTKGVDTENQNISQGNLLRQNIFANKQSGIQDVADLGAVTLGIGAQELSKFAGVNLSAEEVLARTS